MEAVHGGVSETLVSGLIATRVCHLAAKYVITLTFEPPMMTFIVLSRVGSASWSASLASHIASVFFPLSDSKS